MNSSELEALLYDCENELTLERQNLDIDFYLRFLASHAAPCARVLELGCGTGRVSIPLAAAGYRLTGVDLNAARLALARSKARCSLPVRFEFGDMASYRRNRDYDFVFVPYSSYLMLDDDQQRLATLATIAYALAPAAHAIIDNSPNFPLHREKNRELAFGGHCSALGGTIRCYETVRQDADRHVTFIRKHFHIERADNAIEIDFDESWYTVPPEHMLALIAASPLECVQIFGTYAGHPLFISGEIAPGSYKHIYLLRSRQS